MNMNRIGLINGYDELKVRETLNVIFWDRRNEFRELAESLGMPIITDDWGNYSKILSWLWRLL